MNNYSNTLFDLSGKNIFVIGGGGQIGIRTCEILLSAGSLVNVIDTITKKEFECKYLTVLKVNKIPKELKFYQINITNELDLSEYVKSISEPIDVLINHAHFKGNPSELVPFSKFFNSIEDYPLEIWNETINTNLNGLFISTKHFGNRMIKQKNGIIITTSSTYGIVSPNESIYGNSGINNPISYSTTKSAILNFTRYIATHWAKYNIRANCLVPGGVKNPNHSPNFKKNYIKNVPLKRMANDYDYQGAVLFLSSNASSYMTGASLVVDGGWTAW